MAGGDYEEAVGSNLVEELIMLKRRIDTCPVAPYEDRKRILLIERREVRRDENGVGLQARILEHKGLVRACAAFFYKA